MLSSFYYYEECSHFVCNAKRYWKWTIKHLRMRNYVRRIQCVCGRSLTTPIKYTCVWNGRGLHAGDWIARSLSSLHCHMVGAERWLLAFSVLALTAPHCWNLHGLVSNVKKKILFSHFLNLSFVPPWPLPQDVSHYRAPLVTSQLTHRVPCRAVFWRAEPRRGWVVGLLTTSSVRACVSESTECESSGTIDGRDGTRGERKFCFVCNRVRVMLVASVDVRVQNECI